MDEAKVVDAEVCAGPRHHADIVGELRFHQDYRGRFAFRRDGFALHVRAADAVAQFADDATRPEPIIFTRPLLGKAFEARGRDGLGALAFEAHAAVADDDFLLAQNILIERLDALHFRAPLAAGTGHLILDALQAGAVLQHGFEGGARQPWDCERRKPLVDRCGMTGVDHLGHAGVRGPSTGSPAPVRTSGAASCCAVLAFK